MLPIPSSMFDFGVDFTIFAPALRRARHGEDDRHWEWRTVAAGPPPGVHDGHRTVFSIKMVHFILLL